MPETAEHRTRWNRLLSVARSTHQGHAPLSAFCAFPDDIEPQPVEPFHIPAADLMALETGLFDAGDGALRDAFRACGDLAQWRETYKDTDIGQDFLDRFGCYCLIGDGGPFRSDTMRAWVVYMPPHLYYPWHHHPAEEAYLVLAGEATFWRGDEPAERLGPGMLQEHKCNQPHAMETLDHPVMAYVVWRNGFEIPPVLTAQ